MEFYERMKLVCRRIPEGRVATYGQIALLCGKPSNSRQVGYGLRMGLAGEDAPAHRVVNAKGILSGAAAFAAPGIQERLLEAEGVRVEREENISRVDLKKYGWRNTLSEAEELAAIFERAGI